MEYKKFGSLTSSQDPEEIATRIKGIVLGLSSVIILVAGQFFHVQLSANDIISLASELGLVAGAVTTLYGAGMWVLALIYKKPLPPLPVAPTAPQA